MMNFVSSPEQKSRSGYTTTGRRRCLKMDMTVLGVCDGRMLKEGLTNGQVERTNQILVTYLRHFSNAHQNNWSDLLPWAEFAYNNHTSEASSKSPFFIVYGQHPGLPLPVPPVSTVTAADLLSREFSRVWQETKSTLELAQDRMKRQADKRRLDPPLYQPGFYIPQFKGVGCTIVNNFPSLKAHPDVARDKIINEIELGRVSGPFSSPPFSNFRISPLGIVPKKDSGSFRLIHHLSYSIGTSLNVEVDKALCSVSYSSFDCTLDILSVTSSLPPQFPAPSCTHLTFGQNALMSKSDIKSAFRLPPVHPDGLNSLGFYFDDCFFFDKCLPMGFSSFSHWDLQSSCKDAGVLHYVDDFLFVGPVGSSICLNTLNRFIRLCNFFGVPLAHEKTVVPSHSIEFLGITLDSQKMESRLPIDKIITHYLISCLKARQQVRLRYFIHVPLGFCSMARQLGLQESPLVIWIVGHSFIFWAQKRASTRSYTENLSFNPTDIQVFWLSIGVIGWVVQHHPEYKRPGAALLAEFSSGFSKSRESCCQDRALKYDDSGFGEQSDKNFRFRYPISQKYRNSVSEFQYSEYRPILDYLQYRNAQH
ncbi:unnamed protein product [Ranitomeya imitator]|uniref:Reverse transcriptase domain-containing protein n=1 Tax=Ranitomeya imitator TaxID=111125 RepID=A0ABN9MBG0_9NEOB|nr:unnamed protein product [Ranitomeya imitator]